MKSAMNNLSKHRLSKRHAMCCAVLCGLTLFTLIAGTTQAGEDKQNLQDIRESVKLFLMKESTGLPGAVSVEVGTVDSRLNLANCAALETALPNGSRLWGKVNVSVRCVEPSRWAIYVPATVRVKGNYYVTVRPVMQGQTITAEDITALTGDLTSMSNGVVTDASQAIGHSSTMSLGAGIALRQDSLRLQQVIIQGQSIHLISNGSGFQVSTEAQALNSASEGQLVKVKINSGQVLSGTAKPGGVVEVN